MYTVERPFSHDVLLSVLLSCFLRLFAAITAVTQHNRLTVPLSLKKSQNIMTDMTLSLVYDQGAIDLAVCHQLEDYYYNHRA